jgi:hypothetical protein
MKLAYRESRIGGTADGPLPKQVARRSHDEPQNDRSAVRPACVSQGRIDWFVLRPRASRPRWLFLQSIGL